MREGVGIYANSYDRLVASTDTALTLGILPWPNPRTHAWGSAIANPRAYAWGSAVECKEERAARRSPFPLSSIVSIAKSLDGRGVT